MLLTFLSDRVLQLLTDLSVPIKPEEESYNELVRLLKNHYSPFRAVFAENYTFYKAVRDENEAVCDWAARLQHLAANSEFGMRLEPALRDRFMMGINDTKIIEVLFLEDNTLSWDRAVKKAQTMEFSRSTAQEADRSCRIKQEPAIDVLYTHYDRQHRGTGRSQPSQQAGYEQKPAPNCRVCGMTNITITNNVSTVNIHAIYVVAKVTYKMYAGKIK